jgi:hypothetical protein
MSVESDESDAQVFKRLHALGAERFKQRAVADAEKHFAGAPPRYMKQFKFAINSLELVARQLARALGRGPKKIDLLSMARLRKQGLLTEEEISQFSKSARTEIKQLMRKTAK